MTKSLKWINITLLGGDQRELELYIHLEILGATVKLSGFDEYPTIQPDFPNIVSPEQGIKTADVVITPLSGINKDGYVYAPFASEPIILSELIPLVPEGLIFLTGSIDSQQKKRLAGAAVKVIETASNEELSLLNAIPTAEGIIQKAMEKTNITLHGSECFVLGFGRCGITIAKKLCCLGAKVTVVDRKPEILALAEIFNICALSLNELEKEINRADVIINTIPALVLEANILCRVNKESIILDIASTPGGVDFVAARRQGINAEILPGLPGKVAPKTAGKILSRVYPPIIISALKERGENLQ